MDSDHREPRLRPSPRSIFSQQFAALFESAGNPTLRRVAAAAQARMRAARAPGQKGGASVQRISDWKAGRNVPARFESLLPVLLTLIEEARKSSAPVPPALLDVQEWQRLWAASNAWDPAADATECPYLGLTSYGRDDAELFFGRSRPTAELAELVCTTVGPEGHGGIVMLVGASGAGKSSLLAAGLLPALADPVEEWAVASMTPGSAPVEALLAAVRADFDTKPVEPGSLSTDVTGPADEALLAAVCAGSDRKPAEPEFLSPEPADRSGAALEDSAGSAAGLSREFRSEKTGGAAEAIAVALAAWGAGKRRLLIIDQLEELFTLCRNEDERAHFLATLEHLAIRGEREPTAVVIAVRADFYARCLDIPVLEDALKHRSYLLGPMRLDELAEAINRPAELAGYKLESGLEELVISELCGLGGDRRAYDPGALPLVSHVMAAVWQRRDGTRLTIDGYRAAGGVIGSVAATAEKAWGELTDFQQSIGKQVLLGLVAVGDDSRDTRRKVTRTELIQQTVDAADTALEVLARTRLITLDAESAYLTHEIVLDAWPRLRTWIDEDRVGYLERQRLQADASDWATQGRDSALLYRGARLITMQEHADKGAIGAAAEEFLAASQVARRRSQRRYSARVAVLALLGVIALVLAGVAFVQSGTAKTQRDNAIFLGVLAEADRLHDRDPALSAQLVLVANKLRPDDLEARARLLDTQTLPLATSLVGHLGVMWDFALRPDGRVFASVGSDKTVRLWDLSDLRHPVELGQPLVGHQSDFGSVAFSPDGGLLASASSDGTVRLWDVRTPANPTAVGAPLPTGFSGVLAFLPDGKRLATSGRDHAVVFWDIANPMDPRPVQTRLPDFASTFQPGAFSRDWRLMTTFDGQGSVQLWSIADLNQVRPLGRLPGEGSALFSPDGRTLALDGGENQTLVLWDLSDPEAPRQIGKPIVLGSSLVGAPKAFSPDGRQLAIGFADAKITMLALDNPEKPVVLSSPTMKGIGAVRALAFGPEGRLLTGGLDGVIRVWSLPDLHSGMPGFADHITGLKTDATGDLLVFGTESGTVEILRADNPRAIHPVGRIQADGPYPDAVISPDGRTVFVRGMKEGATLYDISDPSTPERLAELPRTPYGTNAAAFTPDSRFVLSLDMTLSEGRIRIWDLGDRAKPRAAGEPVDVPGGRDLMLSPNGRVLAAIGEDVTLWDISNPTLPIRLGRLSTGRVERLTRAAFSPDGRLLASSSDDRTIRVWDVSDPAAPVSAGEPLAGNTVEVTSLAFSPDGRLLASANLDSELRLWDFSNGIPAAPVRYPLATAVPNHGRAMVFHPAGGFLMTASAPGGIRWWDLDPQHAAARICDVAQGVLNPTVWREHLPQIAYAPPCG
ncbi:WD40 repeat domain-containing protein [Nocardia sp. NPDC004604]|uniref:WD40 repeat domain-containing protein n=1 Tax=Nocardia sp. NPDC004604 TaxID=3157013 RepID=UPI0033B98E06